MTTYEAVKINGNMYTFFTETVFGNDPGTRFSAHLIPFNSNHVEEVYTYTTADNATCLAQDFSKACDIATAYVINDLTGEIIAEYKNGVATFTAA